MAHTRRSLRRLAAAALLAFTALALVPVAANAAQTAKVRLLDLEPSYSSVTITHVDGSKHTGSPGLMRLRVTPTGGVAADRPGFCADLKHIIGEGRDYDVVIKTSADLPALATPLQREAAWLVQQSESMVAAQPAAARSLEAGALQVAVWQLVGEARGTNPTNDTVLNTRVAQIRALAAGRAVGGPLTAVSEMPRGCAGRSSVRVLLTGVPGSTATLTADGTGVLSASEVRFAADGTASVTVSSPVRGSVTVTARALGGTAVRIARGTSGASTPQETITLIPAPAHTAAATVLFEDCPAIPLEGDHGTPTPPSTPNTPVTPLETPSVPLSPPATTPPVVTTPPAGAAPHRPTQTAPRLRIRKTGPARVIAGARARYTLRISNAGSAPAVDVTVTDLLPEGMSLAAVPAGATLRGGRVIWSVAALRAGATRVLKLRVRLDAGIAGRRCNRATASSPGGPTASASSCTKVIAPPRTLRPAVTA